MSNMQLKENQKWIFRNISMGKVTSLFEELETSFAAKNDRNTIRLHMGLKGDYSFSAKQFEGSWDLVGGHHNIMYANGLDLKIVNHSHEIETFGIEFEKDDFQKLACGVKELVEFCDKVFSGEGAILSHQWGSLTSSIQRVIDDMINNPYKEELQETYLYGKTLELLVLCIDNYDLRKNQSFSHIRSKGDKSAIIFARDYMRENFMHAPSLSEISREVGLNEFKLKYGFKEIFGMSPFSYMIEHRIKEASKMLRDSDMTIAEISYRLGYSSPQHFSNQYKAKVGVNPKTFRKGQV